MLVDVDVWLRFEASTTLLGLACPAAFFLVGGTFFAGTFFRCRTHVGVPDVTLLVAALGTELGGPASGRGASAAAAKKLRTTKKGGRPSVVLQWRALCRHCLD